MHILMHREKKIWNDGKQNCLEGWGVCKGQRTWQKSIVEWAATKLQRVRMLTKALKVFWDRIWFLEVLCQNLRLDVITCMLLQSPIKGKERTSRMLSPEFGTDLVCFFVFHWIEFVNAATFELKKWREDRRHAHPSLVTLFHFSHYK